MTRGRTRKRGEGSRKTDAIARAYVRGSEMTILELGDRVRLSMGSENAPRWSGQHRDANQNHRAMAIEIRALIGGNR